MKAKTTIISLFSLIIASSGLQAALYTLNNGSGATASGVQTLEGTLFRGGSTAGVTFTGTSGGVSAGPGVVSFGIFSTDDVTNLSGPQLIAAFTPFGQYEAAYNTSGTTGNRSVFNLARTATVAGSAFSGKALYLFSGNGTNFAESTQFLVVKANSFIFQDSQDSVPTEQVWTIRPDNSTVLLGSVVSDIKTANTDSSVTPGWQMAAPVPEPSAVLLSALSALGLLRRRRA